MNNNLSRDLSESPSHMRAGQPYRLFLADWKGKLQVKLDPGQEHYVGRVQLTFFCLDSIFRQSGLFEVQTGLHHPLRNCREDLSFAQTPVNVSLVLIMSYTHPEPVTVASGSGMSSLSQSGSPVYPWSCGRVQPTQDHMDRHGEYDSSVKIRMLLQ